MRDRTLSAGGDPDGMARWAGLCTVWAGALTKTTRGEEVTHAGEGAAEEEEHEEEKSSQPESIVLFMLLLLLLLVVRMTSSLLLV